MAKKTLEKWLKLEITAPAELTDALVNFLEEAGAEGVFSESLLPPGSNFPEPGDMEVVQAFFPSGTGDKKQISAVRKYLARLEEFFPDSGTPMLTSEVVSDPDWGEQWKKYFKPVRVCKNIVVKPTWERYTPSSRDIVVEIDPGMAFGTGQHASTRMCMEAIENTIMNDRSVEQWKVLDVGCGTGILGITAAKMGAQDVLCVDNDPKATEIAAENSVINGVDQWLRVVNEDAARIREKRNLIIANLTSRLLMKLRAHLVKILTPGGYLIISGIIEQDVPAMEKHFIKEPLVCADRLTEKEWVCYVLKKDRQAGKS